MLMPSLRIKSIAELSAPAQARVRGQVSAQQTSRRAPGIPQASQRKRPQSRSARGRAPSAPEQEFHLHLASLGLDQGLQREYRFHPVRRWRFDFAWPGRMLAMEIQGGIWLGGRGGHTSGSGVTRDCKKGLDAVLMGWRVIYATPAMIRSGELVQAVDKLLNVQKPD